MEQEKKKINLKIIIPIVVVIIAIIVLTIVVSNKKMSKAEMIKIAEELSFEDLHEEISNNQTRAEEKYTGNVYLVTGYIKEFDGNNVVVRDTGNAEVIAKLSKQEINMLDNGQKITIVGKINNLEYKEETKTGAGSSYTQKTYIVNMKNAYIEKDIFTITGVVDIPEETYLLRDINGRVSWQTRTIKEWSCKIGEYDITEYGEEKNFTSASIVAGISIKDGDVVTVTGKIISNKIKDIQSIKVKE